MGQQMGDVGSLGAMQPDIALLDQSIERALQRR